MKPSDPILRPEEEKTKQASYTPPGADAPPKSRESEPSDAPTVTEEPAIGGTHEKALGSGLSIASLILGLFGVICCSCCGLPTGVAGIILALADRIRRGRFDGIALAGLITSIVSILLFVFAFATFFFLGIMDGLMDDGMVIPPAGAFLFRRFV